MARLDQIALTGALTLLALSLHAQSQPQGSRPDPRTTLKPGFRDAGQAALNLELVTALPKPDGFFDPKAPAGTAVPREQPAGRGGTVPDDEPEARPGARGNAPAAAAPPATGLAFGNSDLAFANDRMFVGNFNGFNIYVIENARRPQLISSVVCPEIGRASGRERV